MSAPVPPPAPRSVPESGLSTGQPQNGSQPLSAPLWAWGVDPSTKRVAIACANGEAEHVESQAFTKRLVDGRRLTDIRRVTRSLTTVLAEKYPPKLVFVEQPFSRQVQVEPTLYFAVGVIIEAIYSALEFRYPHPVDVRVLNLATWKKRALGNGAAKKHEIMAWAERRGYAGGVQDEADALGVAVAGWKLLEPQPEQMELG